MQIGEEVFITCGGCGVVVVIYNGMDNTVTTKLSILHCFTVSAKFYDQRLRNTAENEGEKVIN